MNVKLFKPYGAQKEFIDLYADSPHLFGVVVAPRGSGKSLLAINLMLYWLLKNKNAKGGWVSPIYNQAKSIFEIFQSKTHQLIVASNKSELSITFVNGATLKFLSAERADSVRGFRFEYLVMDEVAYMNKKAIEGAIIPTLNPNGRKCLMISTPRSKNHFYEYYLKGQQDREDYISYRIKLSDCPYVKPELIEEARESLPAEVFKAEYEAEFTDSTNDVFQNIEKSCIINEWETNNTRNRCYFGIDVGLTNDFSVLTIINDGGRVLFMDRINGKPLEELANRFSQTLRGFNIVSGYVESNGLGVGLYELMRKQIRQTKPFYTSQDKKFNSVRQLISDMDAGVIELPTRDLFPALYDEMSSYTYKYSSNGKISFSHPSGLHDDALDSLWLANTARNELKGGSAIRIGKIR